MLTADTKKLRELRGDAVGQDFQEIVTGSEAEVRLLIHAS